MVRSIDERAHRARIAPASRLSPGTWLKIRWVNPWVVTVLSVAMVFLSPLAAFCLFGAGLVVQLMASTNSPAPVLARREGEAAVFLGKDHYGLPVMLPIGELTRHGMLIGTTGSGKTTAIRTIADSIMGLGGGFCFIDGKSDVTDTYEVLYEIIEKCDRVEDLLVLNFLNPSQSHTFNFMTYGDADFLAEIMTGFLKQAEGDQVYWQERGKILMKAVLTQLVYRRDNPGIFGEYVLTPSEVRRHLSFDELLSLESDERYPLYDGGGQPVKARLRALRTDCIDILLIHNATDPGLAHHEAVRAFFAGAKKVGKIRAHGFSSHGNQIAMLRAAARVNFYDVVMVPYNHKGSYVHSNSGRSDAWDQAELEAAIGQARERGIGVVAMKTCSGGPRPPAGGGKPDFTSALGWILERGRVDGMAVAMANFQQIREDLAAYT